MHQSLLGGNNHQLQSSPITKLQYEISECRRRIVSLQKFIEQLKYEKLEEAQHLERVVLRQKKWQEELELVRRQEAIEHELLRQECESLLNDNLALRDYIDRTREYQPVHTDNEYITWMEFLNQKIKSWITTLSKSSRSEDLEMDYFII